MFLFDEGLKMQVFPLSDDFLGSHSSLVRVSIHFPSIMSFAVPVGNSLPSELVKKWGKSGSPGKPLSSKMPYRSLAHSWTKSLEGSPHCFLKTEMVFWKSWRFGQPKYFKLFYVPRVVPFSQESVRYNCYVTRLTTSPKMKKKLWLIHKTFIIFVSGSY